MSTLAHFPRLCRLSYLFSRVTREIKWNWLWQLTNPDISRALPSYKALCWVSGACSVMSFDAAAHIDDGLGDCSLRCKLLRTICFQSAVHS